MEIIRGTTPSIVISVKTDIDLSEVSSVWIYISQQNKVRFNKELTDVEIDTSEKTITAKLDQEDTLALKAGVEAFFQIRLLMEDGTALATKAEKVPVLEVYKDGVIE